MRQDAYALVTRWQEGHERTVRLGWLRGPDTRDVGTCAPVFAYVEE